MDCAGEANIVLRDGDSLTVPMRSDEVTVVVEVYHPTSHLYRKKLSSADYVERSGGTTGLARRNHVRVIQANGEVLSVRGGDWQHGAGRVTITPGSDHLCAAQCRSHESARKRRVLVADPLSPGDHGRESECNWTVRLMISPCAHNSEFLP